MEHLSFGWIGSGGRVKLQKKAEVTRLTGAIKSALEGYKKYDGISARNVICYNNKVLYILSHSVGGSMWGPYPFITDLIELDNFHLVLAEGDVKDDTDEVSGKLWVVKNCKAVLCTDKNEFILTLNEREKAGAYYSLPTTMISNMDSIDCREFTDKDELKEALEDLLK